MHTEEGKLNPFSIFSAALFSINLAFIYYAWPLWEPDKNLFRFNYFPEFSLFCLTLVKSTVWIWKTERGGRYTPASYDYIIHMKMVIGSNFYALQTRRSFISLNCSITQLICPHGKMQDNLYSYTRTAERPECVYLIFSTHVQVFQVVFFG